MTCLNMLIAFPPSLFRRLNLPTGTPFHERLPRSFSFWTETGFFSSLAPPSHGRRSPAGTLGAVIDERLARALHVQTIHHAQLAPEHEPHVLFQASTIGALLEGAYDGDVTFAELYSGNRKPTRLPRTSCVSNTCCSATTSVSGLEGGCWRGTERARTSSKSPSMRTAHATVPPSQRTVELEEQVRLVERRVE